jgi:hypothetical protein
MEYPTFVTTGASKLMEWPPMSWVGVNESVTIHEFGHQYFQGMLASNEFEQAWLDEGLNTYAETSCLEAITNDGLVPEIRISAPLAFLRLSWASRTDPLRVDRPAWTFRTGDDYGMASYDKAALSLKTLEGLLGPGVFARAMRSYVEAWRFRHPTGEDFREVFSEVAGEDLGLFFDQAFEGDAFVDWAVADVFQREKTRPEGWAWVDGRWALEASDSSTTADAGPAGAKVWEIRADIMRRGDFRGPVEILFHFSGGREERRVWNGRERWVRYEFEGPERLDSVVVDPDGIWVLEGTRADNYWRDQPDWRQAARRLWWVRGVMSLATLGVQPWS